jgi:hypothetical protein
MNLTDKNKSDLQSGVSAVLLARCYAEAMREQVDAVYTDLLTNQYEFYSRREEWAGERRRITENKHTYLLTDDDYKELALQVDFELREKGIKPESMQFEYCPALVAEDIQRTAERTLFEIAEDFTKIKPNQVALSLERYRKYLDLLLGLGVNLPGFKNPLTGENAA